MKALRNYGNTKVELKIAKQRLEALISRKQELYNRYVMPKGWQVSDGGGVSSKAPQSNTEKFVMACEAVSEATGMSLNEEIEHCRSEVLQLEQLCEVMEDTLQHLDGIEATLFSLIIIGGMTPTKAVEQVADMQSMSIDNVWHTYYRRIKKYIDELMED